MCWFPVPTIWIKHACQVVFISCGGHVAQLTGHCSTDSIPVVTMCIRNYLYADDTLQYVSLDPGQKADVSFSLETLECGIADIQLWTINNFVNLNEDKFNIIY